jgi:hypothetical protein
MTTVGDQVRTILNEGKTLLEEGDGQGLALRFDFNGLATTPQLIRRRMFGMVVQIVVPPATVAVLNGPKGICRVYTPGSYWLWDLPPGPVLTQWVDAGHRRRHVGPIEGWSADKWRVRLTLVVDFIVADPEAIATHSAPLQALDDAVRSGVLHQLERRSHAELTGYDEHSGGIDAPAGVILERLQHDPSLAGLEIIDVHVLERVGDERRIEAATDTAVALARIEESARLRQAEDRSALLAMEGQALRQAAEHDLRMAARLADGREQLAMHDFAMQQQALQAQLKILEARISSQVAQIAHDEQLWQTEQRRLQAEWQVLQQQQIEEHRTDQLLRLLEAQQQLEATQAEHAQVAERRRTERERDLLELQLHHEQLLAQQVKRLEGWRTQHERMLLTMQHQHAEQLAIIQGTAQIATEAAGQGKYIHVGIPGAYQMPEINTPRADATTVAGEGLRTLQTLQEQCNRLMEDRERLVASSSLEEVEQDIEATPTNHVEAGEDSRGVEG